MKKRGFTLIELLAVIVILAIIALIATPIVMNVIENARESSYDRSVENILNSANMFAMDMKVTEDLELDKNIYDKIVNQLNGDRPEKGQVYVNKYGEIALSLKYEDYCYTKSYGEENYYKEKSEEDCITPFYYLEKISVTDATPGGDNVFLDGPEELIRSSIEKITTLATNIVPEDAIESWDVTADSTGNANEKVTGKVMAWYKDEDDNGLYEVYIGQEGGVKANPKSVNLFANLSNLTEIDLSKFDTSNVTTMSSLFNGCTKLTNLDLNSFDTSSVTSFHTMFKGCSSLTRLDLSNFDTGKVTNMLQMFSGCKSLTSLNISSFNTDKVTQMPYMFNGCGNLTELNLTSFNTSNVTGMQYMFRGCSSLTSLDLSNFDTGKVTNMSQMFYNATNLEKIIVGKDWKTAATNTEMFAGCDKCQLIPVQ